MDGHDHRDRHGHHGRGRQPQCYRRRCDENDDLVGADVRGDRVGRIRVDGHDGRVEFDESAAEHAAFVPFEGRIVLEARGEGREARISVDPFPALDGGPISPAL